MIVYYKCVCMADEAAVEVAERGPEQDVVHWVEQTVGRALASDHSSRSPLCARREMEYAKIPVNNDPNARVGNFKPS
jgi:hypothetical protein